MPLVADRPKGSQGHPLMKAAPAEKGTATPESVARAAGQGLADERAVAASAESGLVEQRVLETDPGVEALTLRPAQHRPGPTVLAVHKDRRRLLPEGREDPLGGPGAVPAGSVPGDRLDEDPQHPPQPAPADEVR